MSSQDIDLSYNAIDQGYFTGVFADLKIYHLSIEENLNEDYLIRRRYHNVYSSNMLNYIRFNRTPKPMSRTKYIINQFLLLLQNRKFEYKMKQSEFQAIKKLQHQISTGEINRA